MIKIALLAHKRTFREKSKLKTRRIESLGLFNRLQFEANIFFKISKKNYRTDDFRTKSSVSSTSG